jgi:hypothetical protein
MTRARIIYRPKERGNALFLILIAIILFAALAYAVTRSTTGNNNAVSEKNETLYAQYAGIMNLAATEVTRLMLRGCVLSDFVGSSNMVAPSNTACAFYANHGGPFPYTRSFVDPATQPILLFSKTAVPDIGTSAEDVVGNIPLWGGEGQRSLCDLINLKNGITYVPDMNNDSFYENGSANDMGLTSGASLSAPFAGKSQGCFWDGANGYYFMYQVLIER